MKGIAASLRELKTRIREAEGEAWRTRPKRREVGLGLVNLEDGGGLERGRRDRTGKEW